MGAGPRVRVRVRAEVVCVCVCVCVRRGMIRQRQEAFRPSKILKRGGCQQNGLIYFPPRRGRCVCVCGRRENSRTIRGNTRFLTEAAGGQPA